MDLKCGSLWVSAKSPNSHVRGTRFGVASEVKLPKRGFCCLAVISEQTITPLENEKAYSTEVESSEVVNQAQEVDSRVFPRKLSLFPKPLSANDLRPWHDNGTKVRVAYQGIAGAYSEAAALKVYPDCETVPCDQFESTFQAVEHWVVDKAVLPIETSLGGSIHRNFDLLLKHRLHIVGEVQMALDYCILGLPGASKAELKRVFSHPQAFAQCEMVISKLGLHRFAADDTAGAAQMVARSGKRDTGAIASSRAAAIYGLDILADKIQDNSENVTRFLILAREPIIPGTNRRYKTSIVFALGGGPGMLVKALAAFDLRDISLSKVESRPKRKNPLRVIDDPKNGRKKDFDYLFFIDFESSMAEPRAQYALANLKELTTFLRVLGSYPISID